MVPMAEYCEPISDVPVDSTPYEPRPLPVLVPVCLYHRHWISLHLVVRLMFCLQPTDDNWNFPEFPYLYSNSHEEDISIHRTAV